MPSRTEDRQTVLEKAGIFESYYALSQFPGGWTGERVGIEPGEIADLVEAGLVRRVRDDHGWLVEVSLGREIERACGARALWLLGPATARAGMWDLVAEQQPDVLLLDEFEKINGVDQAALLSLMEGGRLVQAKVGRGLNLNLECRVFAAANTTQGLTPEILSRFARRELRPYSQAEFQEVLTSVLLQREGVNNAVAAEIAANLAGRTQDVCDAIRVAHAIGQLGAPELVSAYQNYMTLHNIYQQVIQQIKAASTAEESWKPTAP